MCQSTSICKRLFLMRLLQKRRHREVDMITRVRRHGTTFSPVDQTAYMPFRRKLFCCWSDFKIKNSSETLIVLPKELGYLKRSGPVLSLAKKKNAVFHSFFAFFFEIFFNFIHQDTYCSCLRSSYFHNI